MPKLMLQFVPTVCTASQLLRKVANYWCKSSRCGRIGSTTASPWRSISLKSIPPKKNHIKKCLISLNLATELTFSLKTFASSAQTSNRCEQLISIRESHTSCTFLPVRQHCRLTETTCTHNEWVSRWCDRRRKTWTSTRSFSGRASSSKTAASSSFFSVTPRARRAKTRWREISIPLKLYTILDSSSTTIFSQISHIGMESTAVLASARTEYKSCMPRKM